MPGGTEVDLTPAERAAATKKHRTRHKLLVAADKLIKADGMDVSVEAIAAEAGLSAATFYNVWSTKAQMFIEVFRHYVIRGGLQEDRRAGLVPLFYAFRMGYQDRSNLVRAVLIARLTASDRPDNQDDWAQHGEPYYDPVLELAYGVFTEARGTSSLSTDEAIILANSAKAAVLIALDSVAITGSGEWTSEQLANIVTMSMPK
jgi:AcrR family transcriptional regulator